jgi:hypothetical protein
MSACISEGWAIVGTYLFAAVSAAIYLRFAARILREGQLQSHDSTLFRGSLLLALIGLHRVQRIRKIEPIPSEHDQNLLQRTRERLARLSLAACIIGLPLWFLFVSQTCAFQLMRAQ